MDRLSKNDQVVLTKDQAAKFEENGWAVAINTKPTGTSTAKSKAKTKATEKKEPEKDKVSEKDPEDKSDKGS
jgi:hypothetical protein